MPTRVAALLNVPLLRRVAFTHPRDLIEELRTDEYEHKVVPLRLQHE